MIKTEKEGIYGKFSFIQSIHLLLHSLKKLHDYYYHNMLGPGGGGCRQSHFSLRTYILEAREGADNKYNK